MQQEFGARLVLVNFGGRKFTLTYSNRLTRHGDSRSNTLCLIREFTSAIWLILLDARITYVRSEYRNEGRLESFSDQRVECIEKLGNSPLADR